MRADCRTHGRSEIAARSQIAARISEIADCRICALIGCALIAALTAAGAL
jgi:hypothetical protein